MPVCAVAAAPATIRSRFFGLTPSRTPAPPLASRAGSSPPHEGNYQARHRSAGHFCLLSDCSTHALGFAGRDLYPCCDATPPRLTQRPVCAERRSQPLRRRCAALPMRVPTLTSSPAISARPIPSVGKAEPSADASSGIAGTSPGVVGGCRKGRAGELSRGGARLALVTSAEVALDNARPGQHRVGDACDPSVRIIAPDRQRRSLPLWTISTSLAPDTTRLVRQCWKSSFAPVDCCHPIRSGAHATPRSATGWPVIAAVSFALEKQLCHVVGLADDRKSTIWGSLAVNPEPLEPRLPQLVP